MAARLTGWRLDIKGMTEWEEIRERAASGATATAEPAVEPEIAAEAAAEAVEEAIAIVEEAGAAAEPVAATVESDAVIPTAELDEDSILEALIREEEQTATPVEAVAEEGLSVEDLGAFTLDDVELSDDDEDDDEDFDEGDLGEIADLGVLIPDAGKIRFAEDIVEDFRGGGRRRRSGGGARGGGARGGGARRGGGAAASGGR